MCSIIGRFSRLPDGATGLWQESRLGGGIREPGLSRPPGAGWQVLCPFSGRRDMGAGLVSRLRLAAP